MNLMHKVLTGGAGAALMAASAIVPFAAGAVDHVDQVNKNTGYHSRNYNRLRLHRKVEDNVMNTATVINTVNVDDADTGGNNQNENTKAGDQKSGSISTTAKGLNDLNGGNIELPDLQEPSDVDVNQTNQNTGARSRNKNYVSVRDRVERNLTNTATVYNTVNVDADTGDNNQNQNTKAGDQTSGNVTTTLDFDNYLN